MKNIFGLGIIGLAFALSISSPVSAQEAEIKQIAVGSQTPAPLSINLPPGQGITISFGRIDQNVETVWLDNKRFVGLDTDGCLVGLNPGCKENKASSLHLRLIESKPSSSIEGSNNSLLTVVTIDKRGTRHFYLYNIQPEYNFYGRDNTKLIEYIMPSTELIGHDPTKLISNIRNAINQGLIKDFQLISRTNKLIKLLRDGMTVSDAAREAELSPRFIDGLMAD
jgi:hypothetical protein